MNEVNGFDDSDEIAAPILGIDWHEAYYMFQGCWSPNTTAATREEAVAYLDKVIATGEVKQDRPGVEESF